MTTSSRTRLVFAAALIASAFAAGRAQQPTRSALISDMTAAAIDRGIRDADPPRPPRTLHGTDRVEHGGRYIRGSLIVKFRAGVSTAQRLSTLAAVRSGPAARVSYADFDIVAIDPAADPEVIARELSSRPDVEYAQPRYRVRPLFVPNDQFYSRQWNLPLIDMERAWDINRGASSNIVVAVIDSGVAYRSAVVRYDAEEFRLFGTSLVFPALGVVDIPFAAAPELGGAERFVAPYDFIWDRPLPLDLDGHGTHIAGTIGQVTNNGVGVAGMAFNVRLMPVKVIDTDWDLIFGAPYEGTDDVVARGIRYAVDNGAHVLNLSIGGEGQSPVIEEAIRYAVAHGRFVVVAGGNEFEFGNIPNGLAENAPAIEGMVSVGAIGRDRLRAYYSNTGTFLELVAPGGDQRRHGISGGILQQTLDWSFVDTISLGPTRFGPPRFDVFVYDFFQGTSMATAHVSGFAALLYQQGVTSPAAIEAIMKHYATDLGPRGRDNDYGAGLINPRAALRGMGILR